MKKIIYILSLFLFTNASAVNYTMEDFEFYTEACKRNQFVSCSHLAIIYEENKLVKQDPKKAEKLYIKACGGGDAFACHNVAVIYGKSTNEALKKISLKFYEKACRAGYPDSCIHMGRHYRDTKTLLQDYTKAREFFQIACDLNSRHGCKEVRIIDGADYDGYH